MRARWATISIFLLLVSFTLSARSMDRYAITVHDTVADSLAIWDEKALGFDCTVFGWIQRKNHQEGFMLRFGMQAPRETINSLITTNGLTYALEQRRNKDSREDERDWTFSRRFRFVSLLGPAMSFPVSDELNLYIGLGPRFSIDLHESGNLSMRTSTKYSHVDIALDFEAGASFHLPDNLTANVGLYGMYDVCSFIRTEVEKDGQKDTSLSELKLNKRLYHLKAYGYIIMSHRFDFRGRK